jgi:adenylate kinase family enzyme
VAGGRLGDHPPMRRVAVVGSGGAGKTTFSRELGRRLGLPVVHLDEHYWQPGWTAIADTAWPALQAQLVAGERWIVDGNYGSTLDIRLARADTVIVLAPPRLVCLAGALRRSLGRRGEAVQAPGCPERVSVEFLRWIWRFPADSRPRVDAAVERHREHLQVVELRSRAAAAAFLDDLAKPRDAPGA